MEVTQLESSLEGRGHRRLWQRCTHLHDPTWWQLRVVVCIVATESGYTSHLSRHLSPWWKMQVTIILTNSMSNMVHHRRITQKLCNLDCQQSVRLQTHQTMRGPKRQCLYEDRADRNDHQFGWQTMNLLKQWSEYFARTLQKFWLQYLQWTLLKDGELWTLIIDRDLSLNYYALKYSVASQVLVDDA